MSTDETIHLGPFSFRLISNVPEFPALNYFRSESRNPPHSTPQFELWCVSLKASEIDRDYLSEQVDRTYRGNSFLHGYYVTDHFGEPVYLVTRGRRYFAFGEKLELVVWPYFVKHFLMRHALRTGALHLKAAALALGSVGTLIIGRGGAGKTVLLTQLCHGGARFVTNTHSLVKDGYTTGVASSMRIRTDSLLAGLVGKQGGMPAIRPNEVVIDPYRLFEANRGETVEVKNLCIVDFRGKGCHTIANLSEQETYDYAEQFSLSVNVYRLEEDLLDFFKGDYHRFSQVYHGMKRQLEELIRRSRCYYLSVDVFDRNHQAEILDLLSR